MEVHLRAPLWHPAGEKRQWAGSRPECLLASTGRRPPAAQERRGACTAALRGARRPTLTLPPLGRNGPGRLSYLGPVSGVRAGIVRDGHQWYEFLPRTGLRGRSAGPHKGDHHHPDQ